jgi:nucleoside-diphosphate-sugar epimerase
VLTSIREFTETAAAVLGVERVRLDFGALPTRPEEMHHDRVATDRLVRLTGWRPNTPIAEGVQRTRSFHPLPRPRADREPRVHRP